MWGRAQRRPPGAAIRLVVEIPLVAMPPGE